MDSRSKMLIIIVSRIPFDALNASTFLNIDRELNDQFNVQRFNVANLCSTDDSFSIWYLSNTSVATGHSPYSIPKKSLLKLHQFDYFSEGPLKPMQSTFIHVWVGVRCARYACMTYFISVNISFSRNFQTIWKWYTFTKWPQSPFAHLHIIAIYLVPEFERITNCISWGSICIVR